MMGTDKREKPSAAARNRANEVMESLDVRRMSNADLVKPPSAVKRRHVTKKSQAALAKHAGAPDKPVRGTNRKDPKAKKPPEVDYSRMPTREVRDRDEFMRMPGEQIDTKHKGETLLVNMSNRARGAGVMFNRGQISAREMRAAVKLCEMAELAQLSQLSGMPMGERVDGGAVDVSGSRLTSAAMAAGRYREALERLSKCGRILVENCVVFGMPMEEAVRLRTVAMRLGAENTPKNRVSKALVIVRDALDLLADRFNLAGD